MGKNLRSVFLLLFITVSMTVVTTAGYGQTPYYAEDNPAPNKAAGPAIKVDGKVALASLVAIGDGHLVKIADEFKILSARRDVVNGNWDRIKTLLEEVADQNVPALTWFALPSGEYRSVQQDRVEGNLLSRPYFKRVLAGKTVIGDLVVSKSTGKNVAIVAVPVFKDKEVVGVLGASVYLDRLSRQIKQEMALPANMIFYSFDAKPLVALDWDQGLIFSQPKDLGPEVDKAFREMLLKDQGAITYSFRGKTRNVIFEKSPVTNWWYGIGEVVTSTDLGE